MKFIPSSHLGSLSVALLDYWEHCGVGLSDDNMVAMMPYDRVVVMSWCLSELTWDSQEGYMLSQAMVDDIEKFCQIAAWAPALIICVGGCPVSYRMHSSCGGDQGCRHCGVP